MDDKELRILRLKAEIFDNQVIVGTAKEKMQRIMVELNKLNGQKPKGILPTDVGKEPTNPDTGKG